MKRNALKSGNCILIFMIVLEQVGLLKVLTDLGSRKWNQFAESKSTLLNNNEVPCFPIESQREEAYMRFLLNAVSA